MPKPGSVATPHMTTDKVQAVEVRYEEINKFFGKVHVLRDIDLDIPGGATTCIVGPSGSGKSTLLRCTNLLERPDSGRVLMNGEDLTSDKADLNDIRTRIGMVFQNFNLFPHRTAINNVTLALEQVRGMSREESTERARRELDRVGLLAMQDRRPAQLSGGQQQRVAIARSLALDPLVMLFDEATSALDPELVKSVLGVMGDLASQGMTMIVVTHEMGFARNVAQKVAFLDRGVLVEQGSPDEIFDDPKTDRLKQFLGQIL